MEKVGKRKSEEAAAADALSYDELVRAYRACRFGKRASAHQVAFETRLGKNLNQLYQEIIERKYKPSPAVCFVVTKPKPREIFASHFRDRLVHHLLVSRLEPAWERKFIHSSFACRKGKGTLGAIRYFQKNVRTLSQGGRHLIWALKLDLSSFFITIDRSVLTELLLKSTNDPILRYLIEAIYVHDSREGVKKRGDSALFELIQKDKSWFFCAPQKGLPIGNLTSQFGANVYLNSLDHWIQRTLKPAAYLRYMDDLLLLANSREELVEVENQIDDWLKKNRFQSLNRRKTELLRLDQGFRYLGYRCKQVDHAKEPLQLFMEPKKKWELVQSFRDLEKMGEVFSSVPHPLSAFIQNASLKSQTQRINARLGLAKHAHSFRFRKALLEKAVRSTTDELNGDGSSWKPYKIDRSYRKIKIR